MISTRQRVATSLNDLDDTQLQSVAEFLEFLKFRQRRNFEPQLEEAVLKSLYAEYAKDDRELAEAGLTEYVAELEREDVLR